MYSKVRLEERRPREKEKKIANNSEMYHICGGIRHQETD
jgi:hypothetical protein